MKKKDLMLAIGLPSKDAGDEEVESEEETEEGDDASADEAIDTALDPEVDAETRRAAFRRAVAMCGKVGY